MNLDEMHSSLEGHYDLIEKIILSRQDPVTGLLPASTAVNAHGDYTDAWVRDNVYSIMSVWGLALAYRKYNPDNFRSYLLSQSVVKLMRGILIAMMHQADKVERFKHTLQPIDSLHAKYGTSTGLPVVGDGDWGHLQLDATSLFLLTMAQMIASGLRIVYTIDEVNFIQNLVHYISRTYCTPDYGIWERGHKINHGGTEVNCSSVGMAKAALEALSGFNLFGNVASQEAVIHVVPSDISRSRQTLTDLLPRESNSKETDAALLSIIGYPAYAVENENIVELTRNKIIKKLAGRYGCKRFLLDGHQSSIEDHSRLHYEHTELKKFEHIESEWPLFFTYLLLDSFMREDKEAIAQWRERLEPLFVEYEGVRLLPELYIVPKELIEAEKANPGSVQRYPNENLPLVWAQSLYMLSNLMEDGLLRPSDIDPLRRRDRIGRKRETHPLVAILSENESVKQKLLDAGIESETLEELKPISVLHASNLSFAFTQLGKNKKLGLGGRPYLASRTITTARLHVLAQEEVVFLPYYFNPKGFYLSYDHTLLAERFRSSLKFLVTHWDNPGQPLLPFLVRDDMLKSSSSEMILKLLYDFQKGDCSSVTIKLGPLRQLLTTASVERIDELHDFELREIQLQAKKDAMCTYVTAQKSEASLDEIRALALHNEESLIALLFQSDDRKIQFRALEILCERIGFEYEIMMHGESFTLTCIAHAMYEAAALFQDWGMIRRLAELLNKYDDRLEDTLLDITLHQKRIAIGRAYSEGAILSKPLDNSAIVKIVDEYCGSNNAERVITQEVMMHIGNLIETEPELFKDMITIRIWYIVQLLVGQIGRESHQGIGDAYEKLLTLAPNEIYHRIHSILQMFSYEVSQLSSQENIHISGAFVTDFSAIEALKLDNLMVEDWLEWRIHEGMLSRLRGEFYKDVWHMLHQCSGLVIGDKYSINSRLASTIVHDSTAGEQSFAHRVEELIQGIDSPEYRKVNIEAIESLSNFFKQTPQLKIEGDIILDVLIGHAVRILWESKNPYGYYDESRGVAWDEFYRSSPQETSEQFVKAFVYLMAQ
jgi:phosphorylase kinase alpha/beta subunit